ncbi:MAG: DUF3791 domain-containing protein [Lachnospiraceae bacterium]|nr:DUF3791 domain-containing protein [Lachnospiraceae bacterium]
MTKEMEFFIYLLENYAAYKGTSADLVLRELDKKNLTDFVYKMYPMYHSEAIENAYMDIDSLLSAGKPAW